MELEAENWRLCSITLVRGVSGELEDENRRLCSATLVRGVSGLLCIRSLGLLWSVVDYGDFSFI